MPEVVEDLGFVKKNINGITFKWSDVLDGKTRRFVKGIDFTCEAGLFRQTFSVRANSAGLSARTVVEGDSVRAAAVPRQK